MDRASNLKGYLVKATDGEVGHVDHLLFDEERWVIRYLLVQSGPLLERRRMLISPILVASTDDDSREIFNFNYPHSFRNAEI